MLMNWLRIGRRPGGRADRGRGRRVWFADEAGILSDYHAGITWSRPGGNLVVKNTGARFSVNMISAVSAKGALHLPVYEGNTNAGVFIASPSGRCMIPLAGVPDR
jgi:hypothetical protein